MQLQGSYCALVTPFDADQKIDVPALRNLIQWHVSSGTQGLVIAGSTGEAALLDDGEYQQLLEVCAEAAGGRIPLIAGVGSPSTAKSVGYAERALRCGYDGLLAVTPYYVRPTQAGLVAHFNTLAALAAPVILYNVPGRTGCDLLPETVAQLAPHPHIVGIKEARSEESRMRDLLPLQSDSFVVLSGDDPTALRAMRMGARGVISVVANVVPAAFSRLCAAALAGRLDEAQAIDDSLARLNQLLGAEPNPIPVKFALSVLGRARAELRLPLLSLSHEYREALSHEMATLSPQSAAQAA